MKKSRHNSSNTTQYVLSLLMPVLRSNSLIEAYTKRGDRLPFDRKALNLVEYSVPTDCATNDREVTHLTNS